MEESVVLVSFCCFFAHICSRPCLLLSADRVPRQTGKSRCIAAALVFSFHRVPTVGVLIQKYYLRHFRVIIAAFPERHRMLPDTRENICVLEKQLRTIFLLTERSPEGKLPFIRCQQFFQIGDDLFMRLLRIEPSATAQ